MFKPFFVNLFADFQNKIAKLFVIAIFLLYYVHFISKTRATCASSENVNHEVKATL